ncbi:hypothetical protein [Maribacter sp. MJ134]|nr:hypothetical protein [Maribacter sp. MJ134]
MKKENEVLKNFQIEELEKRFEMGWGRRLELLLEDACECELPDQK